MDVTKQIDIEEFILRAMVLGSAASMLGHQLREIGADNDKFDNAEAGVPRLRLGRFVRRG